LAEILRRSPLKGRCYGRSIAHPLKPRRLIS